MPNAHPSLRSNPEANALHRLKMTELALREYPQLTADNRESKRPNTSYMLHTLQEMKCEFGLHPLCLILGLDVFLKFRKWHWWADILRLANIIVMRRPHAVMPTRLPNWWLPRIEVQKRDLFRRVAGRIYHIDVVQIDLSATQLRSKLANGESVSDLMPDSVFIYICENNLYSIPKVLVR